LICDGLFDKVKKIEKTFCRYFFRGFTMIKRIQLFIAIALVIAAPAYAMEKESEKINFFDNATITLGMIKIADARKTNIPVLGTIPLWSGNHAFNNAYRKAKYRYAIKEVFAGIKKKI
jgi:hypothetical protein